jgi:hypothetical protein
MMKRRITELSLLSSSGVVMHDSCQRGCHGKVNGKNIVMGKERRSEIKEL